MASTGEGRNMSGQAAKMRDSVAGLNVTGLQSGDIWGGMAAAAVILPQAMAFGVALLVPHGLDAGTGALAGRPWEILAWRKYNRRSMFRLPTGDGELQAFYRFWA